MPVTGGSSFLSQHALDVRVGIGSADRGTVKVLWPGGVRKRLYGVRAGERLMIPELPCNIDSTAPFFGYARCLRTALHDLSRGGHIDIRHARRLFVSALIAYFHR